MSSLSWSQEEDTQHSLRYPWRKPLSSSIFTTPESIKEEIRRRLQAAADAGRSAYVEYVQNHPNLSRDRPWLAFEGDDFIRDGATWEEAAGDKYSRFYYISNIVMDNPTAES
jgi:hypothetical protein